MSVNRYHEAMAQQLTVGMRFKMKFEGEEASERRYWIAFMILRPAMTQEVFFLMSLEDCYRISASLAQLSVLETVIHLDGRILIGGRSRLEELLFEFHLNWFSCLNCINSFSKIKWTTFLWFSQVQWDEHSSFPRPDRVSPWEVEPLLDDKSPISPQSQRSKRARPYDSSMQDISAIGIVT